MVVGGRCGEEVLGNGGFGVKSVWPRWFLGVCVDF